MPSNSTTDDGNDDGNDAGNDDGNDDGNSGGGGGGGAAAAAVSGGMAEWTCGASHSSGCAHGITHYLSFLLQAIGTPSDAIGGREAVAHPPLVS